MYHFCTYFDRNYLYRGLALYRSLERHCERFTLWVLCLDQDTYQVLSRLGLPDMQLVPLEELERQNPPLLHVKAGRKQYEYYWTCTPAWLRYLLQRHPEIEVLAYLDADLFFFSDPAPVYAELEGYSVLLLEHRYSPRHAHAVTPRGIFNVSFFLFRNDPRAHEALSWWRERCLEWCYDRVEPGKFGDQKYLDDWPVQFPGVGVQRHKGGGLAPWNIENYRIHVQDGRTLVDDVDVIVYHFHSLRFVSPAVYEVANRGYRITGQHIELLYRPYIRELRRAMHDVQEHFRDFHYGFASIRWQGIVGGLLLRRLYYYRERRPAARRLQPIA